MLRTTLAGAWRASTVRYGRARGLNYVEDYVRVYPDGYQYYPLGVRRRQEPATRRNFVNHRRFYEFCAQFAPEQEVYDVGCGSGHGFATLAGAGPKALVGCDISRHAVAYARRRYRALATVTRQDAVDLVYPDDVADVVICSEVLEHVKDYGRERDLLHGLCRITRRGGLVVLSTPNLEVSPGHGFSFAELWALVAERFDEALLFENTLSADEGSGRAERVPLGRYTVDTTRLHNTHSFVVVALNP